jgi:hypothetical protein
MTSETCQQLVLVLTEDLLEPVVGFFGHCDQLDLGVVNVLKPC